MSSIPEESNLRWVHYDGIYYVGMAVTAEEAPQEVPEGQQFVYFVDGEGAAIVNESDVLPFDLNDTEKVSHPAAAAGVEIARGLLGNTNAGGEEYATAAELEAELEDENGDLLGLLSRKEKKEKKRKEKKEKKDKKDKKKRDKHRRSDSDDNDDDDANADESPRKVKKEKKKRHRDLDSDDESDGSDANLSDSEEAASAKKSRAKAKNEADHWSGFAEEYGFGDDDDDNLNEVGRVGAGRRGRGAASSSAGLMSMALSALHGRSSPVTLYLPQIKHAYLTLRQEAAQAGKVVSAYESDVVRAVEHRLRTVQMEILQLSEMLQDSDRSREEKEKLRTALDMLQRDDSINVEAITRSVVAIRDSPAAGRGENKEERPRVRRTGRNVSAFQDPSTAFLLQDAASQAEQRDMASDVAQRYRDQLLRRQHMMEARRSTVASVLDATAAGLSQNRSGRPSSCYYGNAPTHLDLFYQSREAASLTGGASALAVDTTLSSSAVGNGTQPQSSQLVTQASFNDYGLRFMTNTSGTSTSFLGAAGTVSGAGADSGAGGRPHNVRPTVTEDTLNLFNSANAAMRQSRSSAMIPAFYSFDSFLSNPQDSGDIFRGLTATTQSQHASGGGDADGTAHAGLSAANDVMQMSPMNLAFDHRAAFVIQPEEDNRQEASTMRSSMISASYHVDSQQPSLWYDGGGMGSVSEVNSIAPSASAAAGGRRHSKSGGGDTSKKGGASASEWRSGAKRAILEMLTLYYKGSRGRPQVLDLEEFHSVARLLLDRAVRQEAQRQGVSMTLKNAFLTSPFTKEVEAAIKKSVEVYVKRHYIDRAGGRHPRAEEDEEEYLRDDPREQRTTDGRVADTSAVAAGTAVDEDVEYQP